MVRRTGSIGTAKHQRVTTGTQSNQILLGIITALAAKFFVVNLPDLTWSHNIGTSNRRGVALAPGVVRTTRDQAAREAVWAELDSRSVLGHFV